MAHDKPGWDIPPYITQPQLDEPLLTAEDIEAIEAELEELRAVVEMLKARIARYELYG